MLKYFFLLIFFFVGLSAFAEWGVHPPGFYGNCNLCLHGVSGLTCTNCSEVLRCPFHFKNCTGKDPNAPIDPGGGDGGGTDPDTKPDPGEPPGFGFCAFHYSDGRTCGEPATHNLPKGVSVILISKTPEGGDSGSGSASGYCLVCTKHSNSDCIPIGPGGGGETDTPIDPGNPNPPGGGGEIPPYRPPTGGGTGGGSGGGTGGGSGGGTGGGETIIPPPFRPEPGPKPGEGDGFEGDGEGEYNDELNAIIGELRVGHSDLLRETFLGNKEQYELLNGVIANEKNILGEIYEGNKEQYGLLSEISGALKGKGGGGGTPGQPSLNYDKGLGLGTLGENTKVDDFPSEIPTSKFLTESLLKIKPLSQDWIVTIPLSKFGFFTEDFSYNVSQDFKAVTTILRNVLRLVVLVFGLFWWWDIVKRIFD